MGFVSVLTFAQQLAAERIRPGDAVIDATVGNGVDTLFLAKQAGPGGEVFGFDIQPEALRRAEERLAKASGPMARVHLFLQSHARMDTAVPSRFHGRIAAVMFNLGYLPGAESSVITLPESTLQALDLSLRLIREGGRVSIVVYPAHPGGKEEAEAVRSWAEQLPSASFQVLCYRFLRSDRETPFLMAIEKLRPFPFPPPPTAP